MALDVLTGSTGNIGRYFGAEFTPLKTRLESSVETMQQELESLGEPIDSFMHLAAMTLVADCEKDPQKAHDLNVNGALRWFQAAGRVGVKHFIFFSTYHVYGITPVGESIKTSQDLRPVNTYGRLKLEAEQALQKEAANFPETKLTIARLFTILSPAMKPGFLLTNLHLRAQRKDFSPIPGLSYTRDFLKMEDAISKFKRLSRWIEAPPVVHVCSGRGQTVRELADEVFAQYGLSAKEIEQAPSGPADIPWVVGEPTKEL